MKKKLRQITDAVHGTIYLSNLEAELISTPYFYRLHDIYQSSTVYLTYPCNRTKRYEHSLGVMHLASELLQACLANSDSQVQIDIFENLKKRIEDIVNIIISNGLDLLNDYGATTQIKNTLNRPENKDLSSLFEGLNLPNEEDNEYNDQSFGYYKYIPKQDGKYYIFMYHMLLQAIRIVALYHDVGHPPYSHIVEDVLKNVNSNLKELQKELNKAKEKEKLKKELKEL